MACVEEIQCTWGGGWMEVGTGQGCRASSRASVTWSGQQFVREGEIKPPYRGVPTTLGLNGGSISFFSSSSQLISRNKGCWRMSPLTPSLFSGSLTKSWRGAERGQFTSSGMKQLSSGSIIFVSVQVSRFSKFIFLLAFMKMDKGQIGSDTLPEWASSESGLWLPYSFH